MNPDYKKSIKTVNDLLSKITPLDIKFIGEMEKDLLVRIQERLNYLFDEEEQERGDLLELSGKLQKKVFGGNKAKGK